MASSTLQARIKQFEAMNSSHSSVELVQYPQPRSFHPVAPVITGASSASSSSPDLLGDPVSPTAASYTIIKPTIKVPYVARKPRAKSPSPSPPNLGLKTSLLDLKDWIVEDSPNGRLTTNPGAVSTMNSRALGLPPLPPRKMSQTSSSSETIPRRSPATQRSSNSLTVDHTYPPLSKATSMSNMRQSQGHVHASSTSSFHSVSLSSDGGDNPVALLKQRLTTDSNSESSFEHQKGDPDSSSMDDVRSFETMSSASLSSPSLSSTQEWDFMASTIKQEAPKLPARKSYTLANTSPPPFSSSSRNSSLNSFSASSPSTSRRAPPPIPGRQRLSPSGGSQASSLKSASASDRSSISSASTAATSASAIAQLRRPTPVPVIARKRYDALFFANYNAQRRFQISRLSAGNDPLAASLSASAARKGWRGLSVDLIVHPEDHQENTLQETFDSATAKLDRGVVKSIWSRSRLNAEKLKTIWLECASVDDDSLDQDSFARGMWRIDEELRRSRSVSKYNGAPISRSRLPPTRTNAASSLLH